MSSDSPETESEVVPLRWQEAAVAAIEVATPRVKIFTLKPQAPFSFVAGQHVDVRLTAPGGYQAQRSYSIASAPEVTGAFDLGIELLPDGEVSPFFHDVVVPGDAIEFRGPIGGHFNWRPADGGPILLVGGGSGVVPLMSILRHRANAAPKIEMALVYSARTLADVVFRDELIDRANREEAFALHLAVTRERPAPARHHAGRIDEGLIGRVLSGFERAPIRTYVCGANGFVEAASRLLIGMGIDPRTVRTERFGGAEGAD